MSKATQNLNKAFALFEQYIDHATFGGAKPEALIDKAEETLGVLFPPTYRLFLIKYGCGGFLSSEYYGVSRASLLNGGDFEAVGSAPDGIWHTLTDRKQFDLPHKYIIVGNPGYGPYDVIDTSKPDKNGECPVIEIHGILQDPVTGEDAWLEGEQLAPDFGTYLYNQSKEALENAIENGEVEEV